MSKKGWGRFVEGMIEPSVAKFLKNKGFKALQTHPRVKATKDGKNAEYDLVVERFLLKKQKKFVLC